MTAEPVAVPHVVHVDLAGRTALVTGGGSGIGRACALRLAAAGAKVIVVDRNTEAAKAVAAEADGRAEGVDLADPAAVDRIDAAVDIVVNNAGLQHVAPVQDFAPERFAHIHRVMVEAPFLIIRRALPHMYAQGWGRIVNISSVHGLRASPYKAAYVSAKHALEGLSKVVALEGAAHGVTANCINPAYVRTALVESQIADQASTHGIPETEVVEKIMLARAAIKRLIEPEEVAELLAYLCSPPAAFITGASIALDGGWTAN
ncbi:3-hydroxybutyrate dehydrogenase [Micromonospora endolithica]|uniref:3-hydroxybutyrate dehydrogenase n=1 Tax=Micromonospora endolithica TaxID=230091 RepID=A0A3A9YWC9_9ACTN|nr:3-hydroxybutyrate dehydrogenase [Micromonospora endolithica]RKN40295.1 3-hydroxybutyrate dehydrogenase [Micromonospora endolithica]TWJ22618.1 3-hydroxybutyrate dehydrogenase [Micromonospora endolithica]